MATNSKETFNKTMELLPEDIKGQILANTMAVTEMTDTIETAYKNLSEDGKKAFNDAMASLDTDAKNKVQSAIDEINKKDEELYNTGYDAGKNIRDGSDDGQNVNGGSKNIGYWFVQGLLNALTGSNVISSLFNAGYNLVKAALDGRK